MEQSVKTITMPVRHPRSGTFELTLRCNLHCKMCMLRHADCENAALMHDELTAAQWIDMARQAAEAGTISLLVTGGEPMLRPDFCEIWEGIYQFGFVITLYTNATLVSPKIMETLRKYPPHRIGITLYGASAETYEKVCGNPKAFDMAVAGIHALRTLPSAFEFRTTLVQQNFPDALAIDELVEKEFGLPTGVKHAAPINKAVRGGCCDVASCRVDPDVDFKMKADRQLRQMKQVLGPGFDPKNLVVTRTPAPKIAPRASLFGCEAGMSQYTITYNGKLLACQMIDAFHTDALQSGLSAAWEAFPSTIQMSPANEKCSTCAHADTCMACYATRYAETGDFFGCSDYLLGVAKAKKEYEIQSGGNYSEQCDL